MRTDSNNALLTVVAVIFTLVPKNGCFDYLGVELCQKQDRISLSQRSFFEKMEQLRVTDISAESVRSTSGKLQQLASQSRPGLMYNISILISGWNQSLFQSLLKRTSIRVSEKLISKRFLFSRFLHCARILNFISKFMMTDHLEIIQTTQNKEVLLFFFSNLQETAFQ